jgi:hypothetical protein
MSFLPNDGDIILDAVLTDEGRRRMAGGAGQKKFSIDMYSFADDEINYELYNHENATAYKDLNILKTPVLEAITDNGSALKHKLVTLASNKDYLYLPNIRVRQSSESGVDRGLPFAADPHSNRYVVLTTGDGGAYDQVSGSWPVAGFIKGASAVDAANTVIVIDQGIVSSTAGLYSKKLPSELEEDTYIIQIDDRFGTIVDPNGDVADKSYVDDDYIATYVLPKETAHWQPRPPKKLSSEHQGPRGDRFWFSIIASDNLATSAAYYTEFGNTLTSVFPNGAGGLGIDTIVRVDGWKTGMSLDIPIRFLAHAGLT